MEKLFENKKKKIDPFCWNTYSYLLFLRISETRKVNSTEKA